MDNRPGRLQTIADELGVRPDAAIHLGLNCVSTALRRQMLSRRLCGRCLHLYALESVEIVPVLRSDASGYRRRSEQALYRSQCSCEPLKLLVSNPRGDPGRGRDAKCDGRDGWSHR